LSIIRLPLYSSLADNIIKSVSFWTPCAQEEALSVVSRRASPPESLGREQDYQNPTTTTDLIGRNCNIFLNFKEE
jgi:hypothetical protein